MTKFSRFLADSNPHHLPSTKYRADIDGLRAVAVLSVIGFHGFPNWVQAGFIGVDIFFVISGYLISTIIMDGLERNSFSFIEFYTRRINRIFPALFVVLTACFIFGWYMLLTDEYKQLGKHIAGGAGFISNLLLWNESGYFNNAGETKPLLHLWSLGIEEQFYIVWPLFLFFFWKQRLNLLTVTIVAFIISFTLNLDKTASDPVAAFYSPQTRFWELLAGSALAYMVLNQQAIYERCKRWLYPWPAKLCTPTLVMNRAALRSLQSLIGIGLIITGFIVINQDQPFPGWKALFPVIGAVLIISAGTDAWLNRVVLSNRLLVWFGLISFPLYLWHWPLLVFARIAGSEAPSLETRTAAILLAILLAWLTYQFIEKRVRFSRQRNAKPITLIILMIVIGLLGYNSFNRDGLGFRLKERAEFSEYFENTAPEFRLSKKYNLSEHYNEKCNFYNIDRHNQGNHTRVPVEIHQSCYSRKNVDYSHAVFLWGDSHASHLYSGLNKNLPSDWQILQVSSSMCGPDITVEEPSTENYCLQSNWFALKTINQTKPDVVLIATDKDQSLDSFKKISNHLKSIGIKKIIFMGPTVHWGIDLPKIILKELWRNTPQRTFHGVHLPTLVGNLELQLNFNHTESVMYANILDVMCNQEGCLTYIGDDKKTGITSFDWSHLTPIASDYVAKKLLVNLIVNDVLVPSEVIGVAKYNIKSQEEALTRGMESFPGSLPMAEIQIALSDAVKLSHVSITAVDKKGTNVGSWTTQPSAHLWGIGVVGDDAQPGMRNNGARKTNLNLPAKKTITLLIPDNGNLSACPSLKINIVHTSLQENIIYNSSRGTSIIAGCK